MRMTSENEKKEIQWKNLTMKIKILEIIINVIWDTKGIVNWLKSKISFKVIRNLKNKKVQTKNFFIEDIDITRQRRLPKVHIYD